MTGLTGGPAASPVSQGAAVEGAPDHVIVVMTDQQRADLCAREGFPVDCTPALDDLARSGRWFDRAYTASPLCVPARVSMLTGRFPSAHGVRENAGYEKPRYTRDLVDVARAAGMRTALIGKNHSHLTPDRVDEWVEYGHFGRQPPELAQGEDRRFDDWLKEHPGSTVTPTPFPVENQLPARLVDHAIDWFERGEGQRSFLWLSIPEPHVPYQVPEPYFTQFSPDVVPPPQTSADDVVPQDAAWRYTAELAQMSGEADSEVLMRARANYVGMLRLIDDNVARLLEHLRRRGALQRSLIILVADHGDFAGEYGLMRKGPGVPEVLCRIPLAFAGPGVPADAAPCLAHASIVDILPTVCRMLGQPVPEGVQGRSLVPVLRGEPWPQREFGSAYVEQGIGGLRYTEEDLAAARRGGSAPGVRRLPDGGVAVDTLNAVTQAGSLRMVRSGRWKLLMDESGRIRLFDLENDPYELHDLAGTDGYEDRTSHMVALLASWLVRTADPLPVPRGGYPRRHHPHGYSWVDVS